MFMNFLTAGELWFDMGLNGGYCDLEREKKDYERGLSSGLGAGFGYCYHLPQGWFMSWTWLSLNIHGTYFLFQMQDTTVCNIDILTKFRVGKEFGAHRVYGIINPTKIECGTFKQNKNAGNIFFSTSIGAGWSFRFAESFSVIAEFEVTQPHLGYAEIQQNNRLKDKDYRLFVGIQIGKGKR